MILTRTPHRISLIGGGTDFPAWYKENGGSVIGFAIAQYCYIFLRHLPRYAHSYKHRIGYSKIELVNEYDEIDHPAVRNILIDQDVSEGIEVLHAADVPARAGLGSSSAFTVGLLHALAAHRGRLVNADYLALEAIRVEQDVIKEAVGSQDQCFAAHGGFNRINFDHSGPHIRPLLLHPNREQELFSHLILFFTGVHRIAAEVEAKKIAAIKDRKHELQTLANLVNDMEGALNLAPFSSIGEEVGQILHHSWVLKKRLADGVSNTSIDDIYAKARHNGAIGGKLVGAGGGGCFLFAVKPADRARLKLALKDLVEVPISVDRDGSRVVMYQPNGWA